MEYLAHSQKENIPAQPYRDHIKAVYRLASRFAQEAERFATKTDSLLTSCAGTSAKFHDFGKLLDENQAVLRGEKKSARLPIRHEDAGTAYLAKKGSWAAAIAISSHHTGLPDFHAESIRYEKAFRDKDEATRSASEQSMDRLLKIHQEILGSSEDFPTAIYKGDQGLFFRLLLSCIADADHSDTAINYGQYPQNEEIPSLRAEERLKQLDTYVETLKTEDRRSTLRSEMYESCRNSIRNAQFVSCDSPVGSGKTTAVMAHLLKQASERGLRRIFVVLPFTTIISQSVQIYRDALTLPEEDPEKVVAELHCRTDFTDYETRYLTGLWRSPIIVTTAVAFFETLAANKPSTLRRLHELPGSAIFMDESHAALPLKLLPLAWRWIVGLAEEWGCYWVLGSGSLVEFWKLHRLTGNNPDIPELVSQELREQLIQYEKGRISLRMKDEPLALDGFLDWIQSFPGPRLVIVNTIGCAAVVADQIRERSGRNRVEHLSTALTAVDRTETVRRIKERLQDQTDTDWTLVATSCVEAGVDFSFRTGFRQSASLLSLIQASGRVNRHGIYSDAEMWNFKFQENESFNNNRSFTLSSEILERYFKVHKEISPALCTLSINDEITLDDSILRDVQRFKKRENEYAFETLAKEFEVIENNTLTAIFDPDLINKIRYGKGNWQEVQKKAFNIRIGLQKKWGLEPISSNIYRWTLPYDSFLGYMRGVLWKEDTRTNFLDF